jgi:hypothetical protein
MAGLGGRSPRREEGEGDDDESTDQVDDPVLATIESWIRSGRSKDLIIKKIQESIDPKELRKAVSRIKTENWALLTLPQEQREDYSRRLAETAFKALEEIQQQSPLKVQFWISAKDLGMVPGSMTVLDELDETAVCARLNTVDTSLQLVLDRLGKSDRLEASVSGLAATVTNLQRELREHQAGEAARLATGQIASRGAGTWANRVGRGLAERLHEGIRTRSPSMKRGLEGSGTVREENRSKMLRQGSQDRRQEVERARSIRARHPEPPGSAMSQGLQRTSEEGGEGYELVQRRQLKRRSVLNKGSATVEAEGGEQAPYSVFLSGTSPTCTKDLVSEKLLLCAAAVGGEQEEGVKLEISSIEHITIKIPHGEAPRSKCWKVTVPPRFAEHMAKSEAYPAAWRWRRWSRGPLMQSRNGAGGLQGQGDAITNVGA